MNSEEFLERYAKSLEGTVTRDSALRIASDFLSFAGGKLEREAILAYERHLAGGGFAPGTIAKHYRVIRRLFKVNEIPFPMSPREGPVVPEEDVWAPALTPELVEDMIGVAKDGRFTPQEVAFLALSTTYGLRAVELRLLEPKDFDFEGDTVFIHSAKGSRQRYHLIPEEILPYVKAYDFKPRLSGLQGIYVCLESKAGITHSYGVGWHSIRRTLSTLLEDRLPYQTVRDFLRWKSLSSDMPGRYYSARRFVGRGGIETISMMPSSKDADLVVFKSHPFLPCWGEEEK